ncbi:MAG: hypothetical protein HPZ91_17640 [Lentisphaeria bacterium]|nr:hypothetical protein [Lentisphaeria bacterium]
MYTARLTATGGSVRELPVTMTGNSAILRKCDIPADTEAIDLLPDLFDVKIGTEGYYVVPSIDSDGHAGQIFFKKREEQECVFDCNDMPLYFMKKEGCATLAVVAGMSLDYALVTGIRDGAYYMYPRFLLDGDGAYEDIEIKFFELSGKDASWQGAARRYRRYQLERGACTPLRERRKEFPAAGEAALGPEVRVRLAWKPVPSPVPDQTEENEPPIHAAITFEQCETILDEFHRQGIGHAEFCLVGWNKSGHDGRFPDLFPVEPLLGGEEALKKLIRKARSYGYLICGHTNLLDSYKIAKRWRADNCLRDKDGSLHQFGNWGGGNSYFLCPKKAHEEYAVEDMADMQRLGFYGTHYLDVMSILRPVKCYDPRHPQTRREAAYWRGRTLALAREKVGASASEGSWDFCIGDLDYVLYTIYHRNGEFPRPMIDRHIPFWHMTYHGIVHYNTFCDTVNASIKSDRSLALQNLAWGGRPLSYFYAKFRSSGINWMGEEDLGFTTPGQLAADVAKIKADYDRFRTISDLQFEFMEEFEELAPEVTRVAYSDGSVLVFNLGSNDFSYEGRTVSGCSFIRI